MNRLTNAFALIPALVKVMGQVPPWARATLAGVIVAAGMVGLWYAPAEGPGVQEAIIGAVTTLVAALLGGSGEPPKLPPATGDGAPSGDADKTPTDPLLLRSMQADAEPVEPKRTADHTLLLACLTILLPFAVVGCASVADAARAAGRAVEASVIVVNESQDAVIRTCAVAEAIALAEDDLETAETNVAEVRRECDQAMRALSRALDAIRAADAAFQASP